MDHARKHLKVGAVKVFDTNLIYSKVIGLQVSGRDIDVKDVLGNEIAPVPTSMFDDTGDMRIAKSKSTLRKILQVEVSDRDAGGANVSVLDGSAIVWVVPWPVPWVCQGLYSELQICHRKKVTGRGRVSDI